MSEEQTFEQMLDESFKTIHTGEVVEGTVISVKPEEIALNMVGLSNDNHGVANQWKAKKQEIEEKTNNEEQQAVDNKVKENSTDKNGIPG